MTIRIGVAALLAAGAGSGLLGAVLAPEAGGAGTAAPRDNAAAAAAAAAAVDPVEWLHDLAEGEALAAKLHRPLLLVFRCER
ncbi:MAG: hypothetical protein EXS13_04445 [Planctomycetes bacterium]|nr:hypothetical protein [Planctomycetota bacterium]